MHVHVHVMSCVCEFPTFRGRLQPSSSSVVTRITALMVQGTGLYYLQTQYTLISVYYTFISILHSVYCTDSTVYCNTVTLKYTEIVYWSILR